MKKGLGSNLADETETSRSFKLISDCLDEYSICLRDWATSEKDMQQFNDASFILIN